MVFSLPVRDLPRRPPSLGFDNSAARLGAPCSQSAFHTKAGNPFPAHAQISHPSAPEVSGTPCGPADKASRPFHQVWTPPKRNHHKAILSSSDIPERARHRNTEAQPAITSATGSHVSYPSTNPFSCLLVQYLCLQQYGTFPAFRPLYATPYSPLHARLVGPPTYHKASR